MDLIKNVKDLIIGERSNTDQVSMRENGIPENSQKLD